MCTVHGLQILAWIPVVLDKDDRVRTGQVQTKATDMGREQEQIDTRIRIEQIHRVESIRGAHGTVQTQIAHVVHASEDREGRERRMFDAASSQRQQYLPENLIDDHIDHHFHLAEDQCPMR